MFNDHMKSSKETNNIFIILLLDTIIFFIIELESIYLKQLTDKFTDKTEFVTMNNIFLN